MPPDKGREQLAADLRQHHARLREILELIEKRDLSPAQISDQLGEIADGLRKARTQARKEK